MTTIEKSPLITDDEYRSFCTLIEYKCKVFSVAIARLYKADVNSWKYYSTGVITLVKDNPNRRYCLQLMDMDKFSKVWETVVPHNFRYIENNSQVHCFNTSDGPCLLSFANIDEATTFSSAIMSLIERRKQQRESRQVTHNENNIQTIPQSIRAAPISNTSVNKPTKKTGRKKLTKDDIGKPSNFQHLDHMGLNECFFQNPVDDALKKLLKEKNMEYLLDHAESKKDIYDFIAREGGVQKLNLEIENQNSDKRSVPPPIRNNPPPLPPNRNHNIPPAPPISKNHPHPPLNAPGPPPPGPPAPGPPPPPPPPPAPGPPINSTKPNPNVPKAPETSFQGGGLLSEIQGFNKNALKPKNESRIETKPEPEVESGAAAGSILESLAKYLEDRKNMINADSDDESEDDEDDAAEWED